MSLSCAPPQALTAPCETSEVEPRAATAVSANAVHEQGFALESGTIAEIDAIFAKEMGADTPGCALGVRRRGQVVARRTYGLANLEHEIPTSTRTAYRVASIAKQFTAAAILILAERGQLRLDETIAGEFPKLVSADEIRIADLVHQRSGIRDHFQLMMARGYEADEMRSTTAQLQSLLERQRNLNFPPGTRFEYSNSNYVLLGEIVRRRTSMPLRRFVAEEIFEPLGMEHSVLKDDRSLVIPRRAEGYARRGDGPGFRSFRSDLEVVGDGGLFTTLEDMLRWQAAFERPDEGISRPWISKMSEPGTMPNGVPNRYAYGLFVDTHRDQPMIWHDGQFVGYRSAALRFPASEMSVVCLCNSSDIDARGLALAVADVLFREGQSPTASREPRPNEAVGLEAVSVSTDRLDTYVGQYLLGPGRRIEILREANELVALGQSGKRHPLIARRENTFFAPSEGLTLRFEAEPERPSPAGMRMVLLGPDGTEVAKARRLGDSSHAPDASVLRELAGVYYSEELDADYRLSFDGARLTLTVRTRPPVVLDFFGADVFGDGWRALSFERDRRGAVVGFSLRVGTMHGFSFRRQMPRHASATP